MDEPARISSSGGDRKLSPRRQGRRRAEAAAARRAVGERERRSRGSRTIPDSGAEKRREGLRVWVAVGTIGGALASLVTAAVAWWLLPGWAPELVLRRSPLVEPAMRAAVALMSMPSGYRHGSLSDWILADPARRAVEVAAYLRPEVDRDRRRAAAGALSCSCAGGVRELPAEVLAILKAHVADPDGEVRCSLISTIISWDPRDDTFVNEVVWHAHADGYGMIPTHAVYSWGARMADDDAVRAALVDPLADIRRSAVYSVCGRGDALADACLLRAALDPADAVRIAALSQIPTGQTPSARGRAALIDCLHRPCEEVAMLALMPLVPCLAMQRVRREVARLATSGATSGLRSAALECLVENARSEDLPTFLGALADPDARVRGQAILAARASGDLRSLGPLIAALADPIEENRNSAGAALLSLAAVQRQEL